MASRVYRHVAPSRQRLLDRFRRSDLNDCIPLFQHHFYPIRTASAESAVQADCAQRCIESRRAADCLCDAVDLIWNCRARHDAGADGGLSGTVLVCAPGERVGGTLLAIYPPLARCPRQGDPKRLCRRRVQFLYASSCTSMDISPRSSGQDSFFYWCLGCSASMSWYADRGQRRKS